MIGTDSEASDYGMELTYEVDAAERVSSSVVAAVAAVSNADPLDLEPLANHVDPEALDALFADMLDGTERAAGTVTFPYSGYEITVSNDGLVTVVDPEA